MLRKEILLLSFLLSVYYADSKLDFITKCKSDDAKCIKQSTIKAIPYFAAGASEYGVHAMDPLFIKKIDATSSSLKLIMYDTTITGLKDCQPINVNRDAAKSKLYVKILCTVHLNGQYEMSGRLLVLPIEGKGKSYVGLSKISIDFDIDMSTKLDKNGVNHWDVKTYNYKYDLQGKSVIDLEGLFGGNEVLGRAAKELLKSSSNEIVLEVGPPIIKSIISKIVQNVNRMFNRVPITDLTLN